ncbi:MAG TPA: hypothetical protein VK907_13480, partial [Phnomibacter sp.]|nr:hypothetical protein [Phnomibacter sp.]
GFQWATQFAYDPMAIAHVNTEYQTHYLNLAYTPAKAISAMIAAEVFRTVPRMAKTNGYPADSVFGPFRVSYRRSLSEMNTAEKFFYTGNTNTIPVNVDALTQVAGTGNSPIIQYSGTGAYFLDKLADGVWRLEVMPDAVPLHDPYERTSPAKTVTAIQWKEHIMRVRSPLLGRGFSVIALNRGNTFQPGPDADSFSIRPGTYLLTEKGRSFDGSSVSTFRLPLDGFAAPAPTRHGVHVHHVSSSSAIEGSAIAINATVWGAEGGKVSLLLSRQGWGRPMEVPMKQTGPYEWHGQVPTEMVAPGLLQYRVSVNKDGSYTTFPGNVKGDPLAWDRSPGDHWNISVRPADADIALFHASTDQVPVTFPSWRRDVRQGIVPGKVAGSFSFQYRSEQWPPEEVVALQQAVQHSEAAKAGSYSKVVVRGRSLQNNVIRGRVILVNKDGAAFSAPVTLQAASGETEILLSSFAKGRYLLLPRPYPGFHPLWFAANSRDMLPKVEDIDLLQFVVEKADEPGMTDVGPSFEIEWISLRK